MTDYGHELRFGVFVAPVADRAGGVLELARLADAAGLDLVTFQDHPYQTRFLDTWTLLAAVAARTVTVRVAPNVASLPLRPPLQLARSVASLDRLSGGRVELGLGAGAFWDGIAADGGPRRTPGESVDALAEAIGIIRAAWDPDGGPIHHAGAHYRIEGARPGPAPLHPVELWLGAYKPRMLALTGARADGWLPSMSYLDMDRFGALHAAVDAAAEAAGRRPDAVRRLLNVDAGGLGGTPGDWPERLAELALATGTSTFILSVGSAAELQQWAEEVAPAVRELVAAARGAAPRAPASRTAPSAAPLAVVPTPDDGRRRSPERAWDEGDRPELPAPDPDRRYTPAEQAAGRHLVDVHDHLRGELDQLRDLVGQVARGTTDPGAVRSYLNRMAIRQNGWTLGTFCATYCRTVANHHVLEDRSVFPHLRRSDAALEPGDRPARGRARGDRRAARARRRGARGPRRARRRRDRRRRAGHGPAHGRPAVALRLRGAGAGRAARPQRVRLRRVACATCEPRCRWRRSWTASRSPCGSSTTPGMSCWRTPRPSPRSATSTSPSCRAATGTTRCTTTVPTARRSRPRSAALLEPTRTGTPVHLDEDWFIRRDGSFFPVSYTSVPIELADGTGVVVTFLDRTAQREAERGRDEREEILARVDQPVWVVDRDGCFRYANPAAVRTLGYDDASELLGRPGHETVHYRYPDGTPYPAEDCPLTHAREAGESLQDHEDWLVRKDGSIVRIAYSSAPFDLPDGPGSVTAWSDIEEHLEALQAARDRDIAEARAEELRAARRRIIEAGDAARARLTRDLHDGAQQQFVSAVLALQLAERQAEAKPEAAAQLRRTALEQTRAGIAELRDLAAGIHPGILTDRGLATAVDALAARLPLPVTVAGTLDERLPAPVEASLYFFVGEALTNVVKHARATAAEVRFAVDGDRLVVDVVDDGVGGAGAVAGGTGLAGLSDRIAALDGELSVTSPPGGGTALHAVVPRR